MLFSFSCVSDFKKLHVWQKAHALSLCGAATSIPANIAEGRRQESEKEFARFLRYALNSSSELEYHLILGHDTKAISEDDFRSLVTQTIRVRKMLYALLKCLSSTDRTPPPPACAHKTARPEPKADPPTAPGR
jgi:four helix bundle protein